MNERDHGWYLQALGVGVEGGQEARGTDQVALASSRLRAGKQNCKMTRQHGIWASSLHSVTPPWGPYPTRGFKGQHLSLFLR